MILTIRKRQAYLNELGFYSGKIDGVWGPLSKKATLDLQKKYFKRNKDIDGIYGNDTEILLINAILVKRNCKYFKLEEFKCGCNSSCTGYPVVLSEKLLILLDTLRKNYGKPVTITCGVRCKTYNTSLKGSVTNSGHVLGTAVDIYIPGITNTEAGRLKVIHYWMSLTGSKFSYAYLPTLYRTQLEKKSTNMGNAVHVETY